MIGVPDEKWGETIKALVVQDRGVRADRAGADRLLQVQGGPLQGAVVGRVPRRAGPDRDRQAAEVQAARSRTGRAATGRSTERARPTGAVGRPGADRASLGPCRPWVTSPPCSRSGTRRSTPTSWDAVGLVCGDPAADVRRILLAVDPVTAVADEAVAQDADLLVVPPPAVPQGRPRRRGHRPEGPGRAPAARRGLRAVHRAHQRRLAGRRRLGVAGAGARAASTSGRSRPTRPRRWTRSWCSRRPPRPSRSVAALADAGAGRIGDYDAASFTSPGEGRFRPLDGRTPRDRRRWASRRWSRRSRIEMVLPRRLRAAGGRRDAGGAPLRGAGLRRGRAGRARRARPRLGPDRAARRADDAARVRRARGRRCCRETAHGVRVAGDPDQPVETVALCGGAGDFLLDRARAAGVDVYLTSDLRHHPASRAARARRRPRWSTSRTGRPSRTWLPVLRRRLVEALGDTVEVHVSTTNTDPWTFRV